MIDDGINYRVVQIVESKHGDLEKDNTAATHVLGCANSESKKPDKTNRRA